MPTAGIPEWVNKYIGIPFKDNGRTMEALDCWGLLWMVWRNEAGIHVPSYDDMYCEEDTHGWKQSAGKIANIVKSRMGPDWQLIPQGQEELFDGVLLRLFNQPLHVGLVLKKGMMLHSASSDDSIGVAIESYNNPIWKRRILGIYRATTSVVAA